MNKVIVTTTINPPTKAIKLFDSKEDWELIVVGDLKTPRDYSLAKGVYLSPEMQEAMDKRLSDLVGWNCIQRRNFGLLWAAENGADIVALVDDDNVPLHNWGRELFVGKEVTANFFETDLPAFDPIGATNHKNIWHRGYPLELVPLRDYARRSTRVMKADVQADFWNGDPDIDAVCRMEHCPSCSFEPGCFPITSNKLSPFDSQNTFLRGELLRDYFLFPHIGRMDDIWASYYLQAKTSCKVVYGKPSVFQERNSHNLIEDMKREYLGYENNLAIVERVQSEPDSIKAFLQPRSWEAFETYRRHFR